ncbi:MAG: tRNA (guanosine(46)-N7)-methyltransferase TrmB [Gammaproteobacteria bacterium]|nr:tRNA (guanosine(46)-N7)-methyltransferase TrmB [Gemmatimonadota bacterium]NIU74104.1 tRNA (guanosine(46)-N7)-methyltransferase TrmB [Gammaproteobacteria bacterium]
MSAPASHRPVRSYVRRTTRMTPAQRAAIEARWPEYGVEPRGLMDLDRLFGRRAPRVLEIGFGNGEALAGLARAHPEQDYLGIDVFDPGIGRLLASIVEHDLTNVRLLRGDAAEILRDHVPAGSLAAVLLWFPDPWPKKRHHKRRLVQPAFVALVASRLEPGGRFHLATDWENYAEQMLEVLEAEPALTNVAGPGAWSDRGERPVTKFERRGLGLGHGVRDLIYARREPG